MQSGWTNDPALLRFLERGRTCIMAPSGSWLVCSAISMQFALGKCLFCELGSHLGCCPLLTRGCESCVLPRWLCKEIDGFVIDDDLFGCSVCFRLIWGFEWFIKCLIWFLNRIFLVILKKY